MNIRQGVKRIYILFAAICVIATGTGTATLVPLASSEMSDHVYEIENKIADSVGISRWKLPKFEQSNEEFILRYCNNKLQLTYADETKTTDIKADTELCLSISRDNDTLFMRQVGAVAMVFVYIACALLVATVLFYIARWVINGFADKK